MLLKGWANTDGKEVERIFQRIRRLPSLVHHMLPHTRRELIEDAFLWILTDNTKRIFNILE